MKTKIAALTLLFLLTGLGAPWLIRGNAADEVSCIKCHTDADVMKSLFVAPKTGAGEAEG
ncbi:MAG TPA: hypothetical protein VGJ94_16795 [Syntrophorhabdaceae bacterium]|jgi:hypothetical protein